MKKIITLFIIVLSLNISAQHTGEFVDKRDEKKYKTVVIGTQTWMAENLNVEKFQNGDKIPEAKTNEEWLNALKKKKPAWCYYNNDPVNGLKYGKLYNWYAVSDKRGLAPNGWHISSSTDWYELLTFIGGENSQLSGFKLKSKSGWARRYGACKTDNNGGDDYGFNALPGGKRFASGNYFAGMAVDDFCNQYVEGKNAAYWWTSTEFNEQNSWLITNKGYQFLDGLGNPDGTGFEKFERTSSDVANSKAVGLSVRCVKD